MERAGGRLGVSSRIGASKAQCILLFEFIEGAQIMITRPRDNETQEVPALKR